MMFQCRAGLSGPCLQLSVFTFVDIPLEQVDGVFMHFFLVGVTLLREVFAVELLQDIEHALLGTHSGRDDGLHPAAGNQCFQLLRRLGVASRPRQAMPALRLGIFRQDRQASELRAIRREPEKWQHGGSRFDTVT